LYSIRAAKRRSLPNSPSKGPPTRTLVYSKFARAARARSAPGMLVLTLYRALAGPRLPHTPVLRVGFLI
jgi:hypothetical protein